MSAMETHRPLLGGQPSQLGAGNPPPANPPTPADVYSTLINALLTFAPSTFELVSSERVSSEQSFTRSFEIGSVEVWESFVAALQSESQLETQQGIETCFIHNFIESKLRYWIDLHPPGRHCLLHLTMLGIHHEILLELFMDSAKKRLDAIPQLFPNNHAYLRKLCRQIRNTHSASFNQLSHKKPHGTLSFGTTLYRFPGLIIEVGDSQGWEGKNGAKNKAVQYEDDSKGMVTGVLYISYRDRRISMIGSKNVFPSCPQVKYLDGTLSTYAVEVIPLTGLTDPAYSECLLLLKLAYLGAGDVLSSRLQLEEQEMGFFFTFGEILQMIEMVDKIVPPGIELFADDDPPEPEEEPWNSVTAIQASLFTTPPDSIPYAPAQAYVEDYSVKDMDADKEDL